MLLTAEILWISLYAATLLIGLFYDNLTLLSLTFFFLVLSAVEFGVGLVLLLCQNILTRTIFLTNDDVNFSKFFNRFKTKLYVNKVNWKS